MACSQTLNGLLRDCAANIGGIAKIWIANYDDVTAITIGSSGTSVGQISAITMAATGTGSETAKFHLYRMRKGTASMTTTMTADVPNGVTYFGTDVVFQFNRMSTTNRIELEALAHSELRLIVLDNNGIYWMVGKDNPAIASASDGTTGAAMGDANRFALTLHTDEAATPMAIDPTIITTSIVDALD